MSCVYVTRVSHECMSCVYVTCVRVCVYLPSQRDGTGSLNEINSFRIAQSSNRAWRKNMESQGEVMHPAETHYIWSTAVDLAGVAFGHCIGLSTSCPHVLQSR